MLDIIAQVGVCVFGVSSIWLVGRKDRWQRWGYVLGMAGQPFWVVTTITHEQWGIAALTVLYTASWANGIWNHWVLPWRESRKAAAGGQAP